MAAKLQIHTPYVLQTLPRPLDGPDGPGRYVAGEVFGQKQDGKRRKRTELAVAIDGVAVYLYDVVSSQSVTSYLVSPQSVFTCAPYSLRWRPTSSKIVTRYTYVSLSTKTVSSATATEIKLFKEETSESGTTTTTPVSHILRCDAPIIHIFASSARHSAASLVSDDGPRHDLVVLVADGTILCLNGETLEERWRASSSVLSKELLSSSKSGLQVEFAQPTSAADIAEGMFGGKHELFGVFQEKIHREGFNPDFLVVITSDKLSQARHLHLLALPSEREARQTSNERLISVFAAPLPAEPTDAKFQLDVRSGTLQTLADGVISTYAFSNGIPRLENKLRLSALGSFVRLSKTSVLTATADSFSVYNPVYRSLQASTPVDAEASNNRFEFVTYISSREIAIGIHGANLTAIQVEAPKSRTSKRRAEGLLTDAIRRGLPRDPPAQKRARAEHFTSTVLAEAIPGSTDASWLEWQSNSTQADELLHGSDLRSWEEFLAEVFKVPIKANKGETEKGTLPNGDSSSGHVEWEWPSSRADYARVDRRWVFYAISRIFSWDKQSEASSGATRLACSLPESSVLNYLVDAGHLSTSNIKSAFKNDVLEVDGADHIIGAETPILLAQIDPTMELLLGYLSGTQLGPIELVSSIKLLLRSLGLFEDSSKALLRLMEKGEDAQDPETEAINMELDRAEEELEITERYLGGHRARGLGVAFSKLAACPPVATVQSLRRLFKLEETIGLMNVLRAELIKDGWTTRYLDRTAADRGSAESGASPDGSIQLIADLMSRCIDSVGLSGWMASDAMLAVSGSHGNNSGSSLDDSADFFSQFQAEVSVALEGIMEAVHLQGALAEAVSYAKRARKALLTNTNGSNGVTAKNSNKMVEVAEPQHQPIPEAPQALPLGLKTDTRISTERVRSGGEVVARSSRQIGHFISKKRGAYSVHRISEEMLMGGTGRGIQAAP